MTYGDFRCPGVLFYESEHAAADMDSEMQVYLQISESISAGIWRTPYSEKELQSSGFELPHADLG